MEKLMPDQVNNLERRSESVLENEDLTLLHHTTCGPCIVTTSSELRAACRYHELGMVAKLRERLAGFIKKLREQYGILNFLRGRQMRRSKSEANLPLFLRGGTKAATTSTAVSRLIGLKFTPCRARFGKARRKIKWQRNGYKDC